MRQTQLIITSFGASTTEHIHATVKGINLLFLWLLSSLWCSRSGSRRR